MWVHFAETWWSTQCTGTYTAFLQVVLYVHDVCRSTWQPAAATSWPTAVGGSTVVQVLTTCFHHLRSADQHIRGGQNWEIDPILTPDSQAILPVDNRGESTPNLTTPHIYPILTRFSPDSVVDSCLVVI